MSSLLSFLAQDTEIEIWIGLAVGVLFSYGPFPLVYTYCYLISIILLLHSCVVLSLTRLSRSFAMLFLSLLLTLFTSTAASLPNNPAIRSNSGNPSNPQCQLDACLAEVVAIGLLPSPGVALQDCSAASQTTTTQTSVAVSTIYVTATQAPSTSTVTQVQSVFSTSLAFNTEVDTITASIYSTETDIIATSTEVDISTATSTIDVSITTTLIATAFETDVSTEIDTTFTTLIETDLIILPARRRLMHSQQL